MTLQAWDISKKVKRLNSQKIIFFCLKNKVQTTILYLFESISFAPSIYVTKNPAPIQLRYLTGGRLQKMRSKRQYYTQSKAFRLLFRLM